MKVLHVCDNPKPTDESVSKQLAVKFFGKLMSLNSDVDLDNVDLNAEPPPPYTYEQYKACWYPATIPGYVPTAEEEAAAVYAKAQAEKFNQADVLVLTMPLWNFSMPGGMKSWIDHIIAPGLTFYLEDGARKPLHKVKRMILIVASGDAFHEDDEKDALTPAITQTFRSIGIDDISLAWADGQNPNLHTDSATRMEMAAEAVEEHAEEVAEKGI